MDAKTIKPVVGIDIISAFPSILELRRYLEKTNNHLLLEKLYDLKDARSEFNSLPITRPR